MQVTARRAWEFGRRGCFPIKVAVFMEACELTVRFFEFGAVCCEVNIRYLGVCGS